ncbi:MAG TPA: selenoneine biosynthesis selenosugar synthase SenB [Pyrinomonadaceae bacterium]|nr:selenoneine biosynthesis selenosugar synthase SenB [Pyrinomonadaceae bacterium]
MKIQIVTPAPTKSTHGNRITAERWARVLRQLGHRVSISQRYDKQSVDLLVALHARRSHPSIARFQRLNPGSPIVLALTGTDIYRDIHQSPRVRESLALADRIVVLQPRALRELTPAQRKKAFVIYQSVRLHRAAKNPRMKPANDHFDVSVIGHLRPVKDPFRAALAARMLPPSSRIRVIQVGGAMSKQMEKRARAEMQKNPRYLWRGALSRTRTLSLLARSKVCVISSLMEGGANVLSEAIVAGVPVLASRIAGNVGVLGEDYPGLFRAGDTQRLMQLMLRAETDREFTNSLQRRVRELAPLFKPERERTAWSELLAGLQNPA